MSFTKFFVQIGVERYTRCFPNAAQGCRKCLPSVSSSSAAPHLQMKRQRPREGKRLVHGHTVRHRQGKPGLLPSCGVVGGMASCAVACGGSAAPWGPHLPRRSPSSKAFHLYQLLLPSLAQAESFLTSSRVFTCKQTIEETSY